MSAQDKSRMPSGYRFEQKIFGICSGVKPYYKIKYATFEECLNEAINVSRSRRWNPHDSKQPLLEKLRKAIKTQCDERHLKVSIEIWRTVGSRFDILHGVDGFIRIAKKQKNKKQDWKYFYIDVSLRDKEVDTHKNPVHVLNPEHFEQECIDDTASVICKSTFPEVFEE